MLLYTTLTAAELSYKGNLQRRTTPSFFPAYICGSSLTSFCQTDRDQPACAVTKAYLNPDHFPKYH